MIVDIFEMNCYIPIILSNYQTRMNCLKEINEPLLKLENKSKQHYVMKEMFVEVEIKEMKYPIWFMYLFHTLGKTAKQIEKSIIEFITSWFIRTIRENFKI